VGTIVFVGAIAKELEIRKKEAKTIFLSVVDIIVRGIVEDGYVKVDELGTFKVKEKVKPVRDIHRGVSLGKKKFKSISFKPAREFKEAVVGG